MKGRKVTYKNYQYRARGVWDIFDSLAAGSCTAGHGVRMRRKRTFSFFAVALCLIGLTPKAALGQISGCVDSPEDPTIIMAALGIAAASIPLAWSKIRNHRG